jgi:hypothetical protein
MSASTIPIPGARQPWILPDRGKVGMTSLIIAESAIFTIFVVAYLFYAGKSLSGPTPREVLETPIFYTICLLSSSLTIHGAEEALERGKRGVFLALWITTFVLGALFLYGTGQEWRRLIYGHHILLFGRPARVPSHCRSDHVGYRAGLRFGWSCGAGSVGPRRGAVGVLAFCRRRVGGRLHGGIHHRPLRKRKWQRSNQ